MPVSIFGKDYKTVAERIQDSKEEVVSIETEVLTNDPVVVIAKIAFKNGKRSTGISSVDLSSKKLIEQTNPYEVAETSAVGRALAFAGYGGVDTLASADEMVKSSMTSPKKLVTNGKCESCGAPEGKPHATKCPVNE